MSSENTEEASEGPAPKRMRLVRPPPREERKITMRADFVKVLSEGDSVFRPNMTVQRQAVTLTNNSDVQGPTVANQATQTVLESQAAATQVDPAEIAFTYLQLSRVPPQGQITPWNSPPRSTPLPFARGRGVTQTLPDDIAAMYFPQLINTPMASPPLDPVCPQCGGRHPLP